MTETSHFSVVVLDIEKSGSLTGPDKEKVRQQLYDIVHAALDGSGIDPDSVHEEDRGDGIFLRLDAHVPVRRLFDPFTGLLDEALSRRLVSDPPLRLRMVIHQGEAIPDQYGASGTALDTAFAMVDADEVRVALAEARGGRVALVVSDELYASAVRGWEKPHPDFFRMRKLETKRGKRRTWLTVLGAAEQPGSGRRKPGKPVPAAGTPIMEPHKGDVYQTTMRDGVVGGVSGGTVSFGGGRGRGRGEHK